MRKRPSSPSARFAGSSAAPIVALEKRIAFDGAAAATVATAVRTTTTADLAHHPLVDASRDTAAAHRDSQTEHGPARTDAAGAARALRGLDAAASDLRAPARSTTPKSVVFIESDVPDVATLIKDVDHSAQIVLLDPKVDGVDAIASYLAVHKGVTGRLHLLARQSGSARPRHGDAGFDLHAGPLRERHGHHQGFAGTGCQHPGLRLRLRRRARTATPPPTSCRSSPAPPSRLPPISLAAWPRAVTSYSRTTSA